MEERLSRQLAVLLHTDVMARLGAHHESCACASMSDI